MNTDRRVLFLQELKEETVNPREHSLRRLRHLGHPRHHRRRWRRAHGRVRELRTSEDGPRRSSQHPAAGHELDGEIARSMASAPRSARSPTRSRWIPIAQSLPLGSVARAMAARSPTVITHPPPSGGRRTNVHSTRPCSAFPVLTSAKATRDRQQVASGFATPHRSSRHTLRAGRPRDPSEAWLIAADGAIMCRPKQASTHNGLRRPATFHRPRS